MKRDMDIIRRIALDTADLEYGYALTGLDGVTAQNFCLHAIWMQEADLIHASINEFMNKVGNEPKVEIFRLTWSGCEFADAARSETLWNKAKESVIKPAASFSFEIVKSWLAAEIKQGLPTLRG